MEQSSGVIELTSYIDKLPKEQIFSELLPLVDSGGKSHFTDIIAFNSVEDTDA